VTANQTYQIEAEEEHLSDMSLEQQIDSVSYQEEQDLDALLAQVQSLAAKADNAGRTKTLDKLRDLSYSIETADDTAKRLLFNVRHIPLSARLAN